MRKHLLLAAAAAVIATPAFAQDAGPYVGIEGGLLFPRDTDVDAQVAFPNLQTAGFERDDVLDLDYKMGYDIDAIFGYDFGMFRLEGELAHKRAKIDEIQFDQDFIQEYRDRTGRDLTNVDFDVDGKVRVNSAMVNGLVDFDMGGLGAYVGGGFGRSWVRLLGDNDSAWAYQLIAGARMPLSSNVDVGLKYRFFRTGKLNFQDNFKETDADILFTNDSKFSSHSLLASLIFKFGAPAPAAPAYVPAAPPPPPVAPATQTCPDGTVILATQVCPVPPPPPPPPPAMPGERG